MLDSAISSAAGGGTEPPAFETIDAAGAYLCDLLASLRALVVADDVWSPADLLAFCGLGSTSPLLLTTRDRRIPVGSHTVNVDAMDPKEAVQLLSAGLPGLATHRLRQLAKRRGEWPLLLGLVHQQIWERIETEGLPPEQALARSRGAPRLKKGSRRAIATTSPTASLRSAGP